MFLVEAGEAQGVYMASFDMEKLREYRKTETWGNAFRKVATYKKLLSEEVEEPFDKRKIPYKTI